MENYEKRSNGLHLEHLTAYWNQSVITAKLLGSETRTVNHQIEFIQLIETGDRLANDFPTQALEPATQEDYNVVPQTSCEILKKNSTLHRMGLTSDEATASGKQNQ